MLRSVFGKALWQRRVGMLWWVLGVLALGAFLVGFYPAIRDSQELQEFIADFPPEFLSLFGIDPAVYQTGFGYLQAQMYSLVAPIVIVAFCVGVGAAATAGEEEAGTMDLLLANPVRRARVVVDNAAAMTALGVIIALAFIIVLVIGDLVVDLRISIQGIVGVNLGLLLLGLTFGGLALAAGAWRGKRGLASGIAGGAAVLAFFINGFAPLVDSLKGWEKFTPFHWYLVGDPLLNGPTPSHLLLVLSTLGLMTAAVLLFRIRDIKAEQAWRDRWASRLTSGRTRSAAGRGGSSLRSVYRKTIWEKRRSIWVWAGGLGLLAAVTIAFWPTIRDGQPDQLQALIESVPEALLAAFGITDAASLLTGAGFLTSRVYGGIGLILIVAFAIGLGRAATAGEEASGTIDLLLANPLRRTRVVTQKFWAMCTLVVVVALVLFAVTLFGDLIVDLGLTLEGIAAANVGLALISLVFGALAMAVGSARGRPGTAAGVAGGFAVGTFLLNGLGASVDVLEPFRPLSPFFWYQQDSPPLGAGFYSTFWLLGLTVLVFVAAAAVLFRRRDVGT